MRRSVYRHRFTAPRRRLFIGGVASGGPTTYPVEFAAVAAGSVSLARPSTRNVGLAALANVGCLLAAPKTWQVTLLAQTCPEGGGGGSFKPEEFSIDFDRT